MVEEGGRVRLVARGRWEIAQAGALDRRLRLLRLPAGRTVVFDLSGLERFDTSGAWLVERTCRQIVGAGHTVELQGLRTEWQELMIRVGAAITGPVSAIRRKAGLGLVERVGRATIHAGQQAYALLSFLGQVCVESAKIFTLSRRIRWVSLANQVERAGLDALPILGLLSFLIGIVFAFQGAEQLRRFGAQIFVVNLLGITVLREMGVLLTAIIVAGRSGSAFTAEIGSMRVNDEVDALQTMGVDPIEVLVLPRVLGLLIVMPLLAFFANVMALFGGMVMSQFLLDISPEAFITQLHNAVRSWTFWSGLVKAPVFGFLIAMVGCFQGLQVEHNAESVGRLTTLSVVESLFLIIVADALFSVLFSVLRL